MSQNLLTYDQSLLKMAPDITKQERQNGYSVPESWGPSHGHGQPHRQPQTNLPSLDKAPYYPRPGQTQTPKRRSQPPKRRSLMLFMLAMVGVVLVIAAVLGVVFGLRAANANANNKSAQHGTSGGLAPTSAEQGSEKGSITSLDAVPTLPSLSLVRIDTATQAMAPAAAPTDLFIPADANRGSAASAVVQTGPARRPPK